MKSMKKKIRIEYPLNPASGTILWGAISIVNIISYNFIKYLILLIIRLISQKKRVRVSDKLLYCQKMGELLMTLTPLAHSSYICLKNVLSIL